MRLCTARSRMDVGFGDFLVGLGVSGGGVAVFECL